MMNYLTKILNATVYDVAERTPLDEAAELGRRHECTFLLKREDLHEYQQFSIRFIKDHPAAAIFLGCGCGKTTIALTAISDLLHSGEIWKALIVAPIRVDRKSVV